MHKKHKFPIHDPRHPDHPDHDPHWLIKKRVQQGFMIFVIFLFIGWSFSGVVRERLANNDIISPREFRVNVVQKVITNDYADIAIEFDYLNVKVIILKSSSESIEKIKNRLDEIDPEYISILDKIVVLGKGIGQNYYHYAAGVVFSQIPEKVIFVATAAYDKEADSTILHEIGHILWFNYYSTDEQTKYIEEYNGETAHISQYAKTSAREDFAENFQFYARNKDSFRIRDNKREFIELGLTNVGYSP